MFKVGTRVLRIDNFSGNVWKDFLKDTGKKVTDVFTITDTNGQHCNLDNWESDYWEQETGMDLFFDLDNFEIAKDPLFYSEGLDNEIST